MKKTRGFLLAVAVAAMAFIFSCSSGEDGGEEGGGGGGNGGTCGGMVGSTVTIGTQTWMKSNLNCDVAGSKCYNNDPANCATYGRLYDWNTAMTVCPSGWHLPSNADWDKLFRFVDGDTGTESPYDSYTAGKYLKATSGWYDCGPSGSGSSYLCEDAHGFSALPGGYGLSDGSFDSVGYSGYWWSSNENNAASAYNRDMYYRNENAYWNDNGKSYLSSVRCVKD